MTAAPTQANLDDTPLPLQLLDAEGRIIAVNDSWERLTGHAASEVVGILYSSLVPPERQPEFRRNIEALSREGNLEGAPCYLRHTDGIELEVLLFARVDANETDATTRCILLDTTTLRETRRMLAESDARFRNVFDVAPTPIVIHDGLHVVIANAAAAEFLGYESAKAMVGLEVAGLIHPDSRPGTVERVTRMMTEDWTAPLLEEKYLRADGTAVYGETIASPLMVEGKRLIHVVALDITERRQAKLALAESEERFRSLFESSADAIVVHDGKKALFANQAAVQQFRIPSDTSVVDYVIEQFVHSDSLSLVMGRIAASMAGDKPHSPLEVRLRRADDTTWEAEAVSSVVTLRGKKVMQTTFRDLTERKRTERELALYREELESLVAERTRSLTKARANLSAVTAVVGRTVEMRDPYTAGHQRRVAQLAIAIARAVGTDQGRVDVLEVAARMHDVGKVLVPGEILSRPTKLSELEFELVKSHAQAGYDIVSSANLQDPIAEIVYQHHERLDGSGYPRGLTAESLLPESRILMVADVFEAMASHRPYRPALGTAAALAELTAGSGIRYDIDIVDACESIVRDGFVFAED